MENGKRSHKDKVFVVIIVLKLKAEIPFDQKFTFISSCLKLFSEKKKTIKEISISIKLIHYLSSCV